jgi:hypothetical protein
MTPREMRIDLCRPSIVCALVIAGLIPCVEAGAANNPCKATAGVAFDACKAAAKSDRLIAVGKCDNEAAPAAKAACTQQAASDATDALATCQAERAVRQAACKRFGRAAYEPGIDPANFVPTIDNPYFPLIPGTTFTYLSHLGQDVNEDDFVVTHNTKLILGVTCTEVHDTVKTNGEVVEDTLDWFAQDRAGNVWYFGEDTMELAGGRPTTLDGTFEAGVNRAKPGIVMEAHPKVGDFYRQEFDLENAEDNAEVVSFNESVTVPVGSFASCLKTTETTPLEPDLTENKFYAVNVGNVLTVDLTTGERVELVSVTTGG